MKIVYYYPNIVFQDKEEQQRTGEISLGGNEQEVTWYKNMSKTSICQIPIKMGLALEGCKT